MSATLITSQSLHDAVLKLLGGERLVDPPGWLPVVTIRVNPLIPDGHGWLNQPGRSLILLAPPECRCSFCLACEHGLADQVAGALTPAAIELLRTGVEPEADSAPPQIDRIDDDGRCWAGDILAGTAVPCVDDLHEFGFESQVEPPGFASSAGPDDAGLSPAAEWSCDEELGALREDLL